ncbi:LOW QUALITY PROTEIN: hypothetical protein, conserved [Eimeria necatrix]|uniref:CRAL-TRIO domain-containing protein n=1 Tax=Eimeria necatrix TaxID=51315 RepID=U6MWH4_9EIME|nr:LOW QUALITY PROTEIN: hypothetical protein, conserved [Eimeria necatrix]CDJ66854.1 hypothetical protein, conserved [Eimeria necatrix]
MAFYFPRELRCRPAESALLARVEAKHSTFPTYVHGMSKAGNPVIYKPSLSGLRDFRRLFVLQTDSYLIDTWLEETKASAFTLVLDFGMLTRRLRAPTLDMWESLRSVVDPLPAEARSSIEQMVHRVFARCEAVVVVNATTFLKLLKPVISLMVPVSSDKLFVSTDYSALFKVVSAPQVPRPYNPSSPDVLSSSAHTTQLYTLLNARAQEVLGRPLQIDIPAAMAPPPKKVQTDKEQPPVVPSPKPTPAPEERTVAEALEVDQEDLFDDID